MSWRKPRIKPEPAVIIMSCPDCRKPGYYDHEGAWHHVQQQSRCQRV
jgi:hypothetical protein